MNKADASTEPSSPDLAASPPKLPERLEYYRPIKVLGQGGMGTVYLAEDTRLGREVAIKTLRPELAINPQAKERFLREARTAAKLEHDNVIPIYSVGEADGTPFLAMPLLKGEPLDALIRRTAGPLPVATVVRIAREAASGLAAAHERGLIHRDIKPANIWLEAPTGRVKILDFGLAKAADTGGDVDSETHLTASGAIVGTPAYMAPEQASGHPVDGRADLFSLGCVLYELLSGKRAFSGPNTMSILMSLANHTPTAPDKLSDQCPAALSRLVMQLLEKDPTKRPASAEAVIQALDGMSIENATTVQASRGASAPGPSQDATHLTGLTTRDTDSLSGTALAAGTSPTITDLERPVASAKPLTASDSHLTLPSTAAFPVRRRAIPKSRVALGLVGLLLVLLAAVIVIKISDRAELVITSPEPGLEVKVVQLADNVDGALRDPNAPSYTLHPGKNSVRVRSGQVEVVLTGANADEYEVGGDKITLKRFGRAVVEIKRRQMIDKNREGEAPDEPLTSKSTGRHGWSPDAPLLAIAPFNADEARQHQEAWAKYLNMPVEYENTIGMKFRVIPPGEFSMGASDEEFAALEKNTKVALAAGTITQAQADEALKLFAAETPQHRVRLTNPLAFGACEVTQAQYERVMGVNPSWWSATGRGKEKVVGISTSEHPVGGVNWIDAVSFCNTLSQSEGLTPCYEINGTNVKHLAGNGYRLATDAEWEYACRAGTTTTHSSGSIDWLLLDSQLDAPNDYGWVSHNSNGMTHPVGRLKANPFGLHDMHGNAQEWCDDTYDANAYAERARRNAVIADPRVSQVDGKHIARGGEYQGGTHMARSALRHILPHAENATSATGFRVVCSADAVRQSPKLSEQIAAIQNAPQVERSAATKVLQAGGAVTVQLLGGDPWAIKVIKPGEPLPNGPFVVHGVNFRDQPGRENVGDDALIALAECRHIASLSLSGTNIGPRGAIVLSGFPALRYLHLGQKQPTSTLLGMAGLTALSAIELETAQIDDGFEYLKAAKALRNLTLWGEQRPDWQKLGELTQLRAVNFPDLNELDAADVEAFQKRNPHCQVWVNHGANRRWLGRNVVGEAASQLLARKFVLEGWRSGTTSVKRLAEDSPNKATVDHVQTLYLPAEIAVTEDDLALIDQLNGDLQQCHATGQPQSDHIAATLARNPALVAVSFRNGPFSDDGLKSLQSLTGLRLLVVDHTQATPAGIAAFRRAVPGCHIVSDFGTFDPQWLPPDQFDLNRRIAARVLDRGGYLQLSAEGSNWQHVVVAKPMALPAGRFLIDILSFKNCPTVVSSDLAGVGDLRQLRLFGFPYTQVNRDAIPHIRNLRGVVDFAPNECGLKSSDLDQLPEWPTVEVLWLTASMIDDKFQSLRRFPNLRLLSLAVDGPLPDLTTLGQFPHLRHVIFYRQTAIPPEVVQELQRRNPRLLITMGDESGSQTLGEDVARKAARKLLELGIPVLHNEIQSGPFKPTTLAEVDTVKACQWHCDEIPASVSFEVAHHALLTHVEHFHFAAIGCRHADPLAVALTEHQGMRSVNLQKSDLTDEGLKTLAKLRALRTLIVTKTRITRAGAEEFHRLVPDCWLHTDFGIFRPDFMSIDAARPN